MLTSAARAAGVALLSFAISQDVVARDRPVACPDLAAQFHSLADAARRLGGAAHRAARHRRLAHRVRRAQHSPALPVPGGSRLRRRRQCERRRQLFVPETGLGRNR